MSNYLRWIFCIGILSSSWTGAQTEPGTEPQAKKEIAGRKAWVLCTSIPEDIQNPLPVMSGEKIHEVRMYLRSIGDPIPVDESGLVRAVKPITGEDKKITYQELSRSVIPPEAHEALIVLVPKPKNSEGPRFNSKVIDLSKFKAGGCLYVNLVKTKIGVTIGDLKTVVNPGEMEFINPLEDEKSGVFVVRFFYEIPKEPDAEWKLMTSSKMAIYKSRREICIFYYNEEIENVDFRGIPFMTPPPLKPQQP